MRTAWTAICMQIFWKIYNCMPNDKNVILEMVMSLETTLQNKHLNYAVIIP